MKVCSKLIVHSTNKKQNLVFNGYTGGLDAVSAHIAAFLSGENTRRSELDPQEIAALKDASYILDDEDKLANRIFDNYNAYVKTLKEDRDTYVICPTLDCNLFCPYCYEQGNCNRGEYLTEEALSAIFNFMTQNTVSKGRTGYITFFGGEPLLPKNIPINEKVFQYSREHGFVCGIITNGSTIGNEAVHNFLLSNKDLITSVQVSIDGTQEYHDTVKFFADGSGTFTQVMDNILTLLRMGIPVCVRINISKHNFGEIYKIAEFLMNSPMSYFDIFKFYFAPITNSSDMNDPDVIDEADLAIELERINLLDKCQLPLLGYLISAVTNCDSVRLPAFRRCDANKKNYFVLSPDGYVYPCMELLGQPKLAKYQYIMVPLSRPLFEILS